MDKRLVYQKILQFFSDKPVKKIAVFGSFARSEQTMDSDIDLIITTERPVGLFKLSSYKNALEKILGISVDLATEKGISAMVLPYIKKDMEVIYES